MKIKLFLSMFLIALNAHSGDVSLTIDVLKVTASYVEKAGLRKAGKKYTEAQYDTFVSQLSKSAQGRKVFGISAINPNKGQVQSRSVTVIQTMHYDKKWKKVALDLGLRGTAASQVKGQLVETELKLQCSYKKGNYKFENQSIPFVKEIDMDIKLFSYSGTVQIFSTVKVDASSYLVFTLHTGVKNPDKAISEKSKNVNVSWDTLKVKTSVVNQLGLGRAGKSFTAAEYSKIIKLLITKKNGFIDDSSSTVSVPGKTMLLRNLENLYHYNTQDKIHFRSFGTVLECTPNLHPDGKIDLLFKPQVLRIIGYRKKNAPILNVLVLDSQPSLKGEHVVLACTQKGNISYITVVSAVSSDLSITK